MNLLHATALLDEQSEAVDGLGTLTSSLLVEVTNLENVLEAIQSDLDNLVVRAHKEIAQRLDTALGNQVADLLRLLKTARGGVADGPASLLSGLEVTILKEVDQRRDQVGINDSLDLGRVAGGDVGDGPACLLADAVLSGAKEGEQAGQGTAVNDELSLDIIAGDDVTNRAKCRSLDRGGSMHQKFGQASRNASLDNGLDLVVGAIGEV
jgi:hypothetical protein